MTKKANLNTEVNLNMNINDEPHLIAEKIMDGFLIPVLNRKTQVSGLQDSVQLYIDLSYLMLSERVRMIGRDGISEMRELINELEDELNTYESNLDSNSIVQQSDFLEISARAS